MSNEIKAVEIEGKADVILDLKEQIKLGIAPSGAKKTLKMVEEGKFDEDIIESGHMKTYELSDMLIGMRSYR